MKRAIVHCGMHKTGSSSIQNTLLGLEDSDILYAPLGPANHSNPIATMFSENPQKTHANQTLGLSKTEVWGKRKNQIEKFSKILRSKQDVVLISAEVLSSAPESLLINLHNFIICHNRTPEYYAYVRDPIGFASSAYQQRLKTNPGTTIAKIRQYRKDFMKFKDLTKTNGLTLWPFEPSNFPNNSVVQDFVSRLGLSTVCPPEKRRNESMSETTAKLVYTFNKTFPASTGDRSLYKARMSMISVLNETFKGPNFKLPVGYITEEMIDWNDIAYLREEFGIDFEPKTRENLEKTSNVIDEAQFDRFMRKFPKQTQEQLADFIFDLGISCPEKKSIPKMLARLYLHFVQAQARSG